MGISYLEKLGYKPYRQNYSYHYKNGSLDKVTAEGGVSAKRKSAIVRSLKSKGYDVKFIRAERGLWQVWTKPMTTQSKFNSALSAPLISFERKHRRRPSKKWLKRFKR